MSWASGDLMRLEAEDEELVFPSTTAPSFGLQVGRTGCKFHYAGGPENLYIAKRLLATSDAWQKQTKFFQTLLNVSWDTKSPLVENY